MQSRKVALVAWELGAGRGHLEHLRPIVTGLLGSDWTVIAAVRDLKGGHAVLGAIDAELRHRRFAIGQAPIFVHPATRPSARPSSLAEVLAQSGFGEASFVRPVVETWVQLIEAVKPDVIVADFSPSVVAAAQERIPVLMTGNGWTIPPDGSPIPPLPIQPYAPGAAAGAEARICDVMEQATNWRPDRFARLLRGDTSFIFTSALLDPYRAARREPVCWPPNLIIPQRRKKSSAGHVMTYLPGRHPAIVSVVEALGLLGIEAHAHLGGLVPEAPANVKVEPKPLDLASLLPDARCVIHHGGLGTASWCLAYRIPQVIIPLDLEKSLIAHAVEASGSGIVLPLEASQDEIAAAIGRAMQLTPSGLGPSAFSNAGPDATVQAILNACDAAIT